MNLRKDHYRLSYLLSLNEKQSSGREISLFLSLSLEPVCSWRNGLRTSVAVKASFGPSPADDLGAVSLKTRGELNPPKELSPLHWLTYEPFPVWDVKNFTFVVFSSIEFLTEFEQLKITLYSGSLGSGVDEEHS